jgi:NADH-quinone oxidoreductase subunit H
MGVGSAMLVVPFSSDLILGDLNVGVFYAISITSLATVGVLLAGWSSNNKWSLVGGVRAASQMISYEVPAALSALAVVMLSGSMSMQEIVKSQGAWPWEWNISHSPFMLASFFILFISLLAEGSRTPFDLPEGESELVSGFNTEYSGIRFAIFFLAEWGNLFIMGSLISVLFLGGWTIPFTVESSVLTNFLQFGSFIAKTFFIVFIIIQLRWTLPRVRIDQLMKLCWSYLVPISLVIILVIAIWMNFLPQTKGTFTFQTVIQIFTMFIWMGFIALVIFRAFKNHSITKA